ncbi:uncharacterized protein TEOVI_000278400 [Trypanosoma equiperdum]|uniref:Uncharacterized protein n=4 Tax=Trypanozoon TaxID=39700 RepID=Q57WV3_TRYB2|nr:hypothetical protein, conserved [Trypanosoma brucei gambiense DAL972]XP_843666.1 hypothetical protein, conserved [Trypanosoma brucei brucei TREU927]AAX69924.1 hypothetical protein, conserved [Trypanosoma brucei]RHW73643.1 hypothetical protein DPX39_030008100 [Trypanosoma brucei equiperdum]SCU71204.1 hypothetical protein, conserved [Trypanosoma equiperdum]AAZ10107.1 hypothetical protein, conserved [Trypanosoma brucei brucei TREU927]CBH09692.1 hypothetical protein, conserved [Trypanosoma bru|eukprot:XP_011771985.1 hypothetical protein, conserved [Trypanosoma brucei gambiense DAL972]
MLRRSVPSLYSTIVAPIGKGRVVPLNFSGPKPVYQPKSFVTQFNVLGMWTISNMIPNFIFGALLIAGAHGGLAGAWPPDPHSLHP